MVTIRDEETERYLRKISQPIFAAAGFSPTDIQLIIVQDQELNAFVANGMKIFIHTGLLTFSDDPAVIAGVIAHETGHITGGHLSRLANQMDKSGGEAAAGYILGLAAAAAGAPDAALALMLGGQHFAERGFLKFSRIQEESADQAGVGFLNQAQYSASGLLALLQALQERERGYKGLNPYTLTHPLSKERVEHLRFEVQKNSVSNAELEKLEPTAKRVTAKLRGFLEKPKQIRILYPESDQSFSAQYARTIAAYREPNLDKALAAWKKLAQAAPNDPYLLELKGQILFENGRIDESILSYKQALAALPDADSFAIGLASAYLAQESNKYLPEATSLLENSVAKDRLQPFAWHQLAVAYGRQDRLGDSYVALAEEAALRRNKKDMEHFSDLALRYLKEGSPKSLRVQDIKESAADIKNKK